MTFSRVCLVGALFCCAAGPAATAGTLTFSGTITQPVDPGNPASNSSLNAIQELDSYIVTLVFPGTLTVPGFYDLTGSSLTFSDPAASASESAFSSISLTLTQSAGFDVFSLLGCLTTGDGCNQGNELDANFEIPAASFSGLNVSATGLDQPHPLDLLEDDGVTDVQGNITGYSLVQEISSVPEPSSVSLTAIAALALLWKKRRG
jgi:hypothetical protein